MVFKIVYVYIHINLKKNGYPTYLSKPLLHRFIFSLSGQMTCSVTPLVNSKVRSADPQTNIKNRQMWQIDATNLGMLPLFLDFFSFNFKPLFSADFDYWDYVVPEPNLNEVIFEETTCQSLVKMLENCLSKSKQTKLGCSKVLVPEKLTQRIAQDVLRLSSTEPCGLRGCVMHVNMEVENVCIKLDRIVCDSSVVPTFELTLVFKQENCSWSSFRDFFFSRGRFSSSLRRTLILSSGFRLVKKKLYSLIGTTVIEEC